MARMNSEDFSRALKAWCDKVITAQADENAGRILDTDSGGFKMYHYDVMRMLEDVNEILAVGFDKSPYQINF